VRYGIFPGLAPLWPFDSTGIACGFFIKLTTSPAPGRHQVSVTISRMTLETWDKIGIAVIFVCAMAFLYWLNLPRAPRI
jgi:hypothetical protein